MKLRRIAELLSRGRVFKRHLTTAHGRAPLFVSPDAQLKYLKLGGKAFDSDLIDIADRIVAPDHVVWDIGANVGTFAAACAHRSTATVLAVEADIWLIQVLRQTRGLDAYRDRDLRVLPVAVSETNGVYSESLTTRDLKG